MRRAVLIHLFLVLQTACTAGPAGSTPRPVDLIPYATSTRAPRPTPEGLIPLTTPLPSPTPFTYTVQSGDTMSQIAEQFNVPLDALQAANPEVSSNAMFVGQVINIPGNPSSESPPPPAPFDVDQIVCYPTVERGMWCFVLAYNNLLDTIENVSAQVTLVDLKNNVLVTQTAFLVLDVLLPGASLPLAVYFTPDIPFDAKPQVQILTAIPLSPDDTRYVPATVNNVLVEISAEGHSAQISGVISAQSQTSSAGQVWVVATAYDEQGIVVGFRKWESNAGLPAGGNLPFEFVVSSVGGRIDRVEFAVEARP